VSAEEALWPALIAWKREVTGENAVGLSSEDVAAIRAATIDRWRARPASGPLTLNVALEIISHEAIVREAYKDSVGVWTWGIGVTNASGHHVNRYKDNPQTVERCLEIYLWLLQTKYAPDVLKAFKGFSLTEAQFAAALSFHYNTGAILKADWVAHWKGGAIAQARLSFMNWRKPASIIPRREKERDLFFDGTWSNDGCATIFPVKKPSYQPDFAHPERVDVRPILTGLLA
jgi:lysozyme